MQWSQPKKLLVVENNYIYIYIMPVSVECYSDDKYKYPGSVVIKKLRILNKKKL